jgi:hypothetical protein
MREEEKVAIGKFVGLKWRDFLNVTAAKTAVFET